MTQIVGGHPIHSSNFNLESLTPISLRHTTQRNTLVYYSPCQFLVVPIEVGDWISMGKTLIFRKNFMDVLGILIRARKTY